MSLSDSCFDFEDAVRQAAARLAVDVESYAKFVPSYYTAQVIEVLRQACAAAVLDSADLAALVLLVPKLVGPHILVGNPIPDGSMGELAEIRHAMAEFHQTCGVVQNGGEDVE